MARIRVGAASWTDHAPFYPVEYDKASMKTQRISYYARYFSLVEVDSTFYSLQPARNFQQWAPREPPRRPTPTPSPTSARWSSRCVITIS